METYRPQGRCQPRDHVSGIIAANRNDKKATGVFMIAKIMVLRAVPDGDEYDKDIALAIRYAADNGAKVTIPVLEKVTLPTKVGLGRLEIR